MPGSALRTGTQPDQFGNLRLDDLDPPFHRQRVIAASGVEVEMEPVLARLRLRHLLKPDRRAQPSRVEEPVAEGRIFPQPGSGQICLKNASSYCIESNGTGNQVTITNNSADYSNFTVVRTNTVDGYHFYQWQNGNENCLREGTRNVVKIENGGCSMNDNAAWWEYYKNEVVTLNIDDAMLTRGDVSGYKVFAFASIASGDWAKWNVPT